MKIKKVVDREPVLQAWSSVEAQLLKMRPSTLTPESERFIDYAWKPFDPKRVLSVLTSKAASYIGHKEILFAGLCAFVICPNRAALLRHGMLLQGIEFMCLAEAGGRKRFPESDLLGDIASRIFVLGLDFYNDFYFPIGGLRAVLRSSTPGQYNRSLYKRSREVPSVVGLMRIFHFHAEHLRGNQKYHTASLNKACELVSEFYRGQREQGGVAKDNVDKRWLKLNKCAALIYAASTMQYEDNSTLLDAIRNGAATYDCELLQEWIARARFATTHILEHCYSKDFAKANEAYLPKIKEMEIMPPQFEQSQQQRIRKMFAR